MIGMILDQLVTSGRFKELVVRYSFYTFNGILAGIFLNDIIRLLYGDFNEKHNFQFMIAGAVAGSGYLIPNIALFGDKNNNLFLGGGLALGHWWSELSEKGEKIEVVGDKQ